MASKLKTVFWLILNRLMSIVGINKPRNVVLSLTGRCNYKCVKCGIWEEKNTDLLYSQDVKAILFKLKKWLGSYILVISGGEPLLRKDIFEIIRFCNENNIVTHLLTNGYLLNKKTLSMLDSSGLSYMSISLESLDSKIHDSIVGLKGSCEKIKRAIFCRKIILSRLLSAQL